VIEVKLIVAGNHATASTLAEGAETAAGARIWSHQATDEPDSVASLAQALIGFEAEATGQQVDSIVLADDSDAALAAALVGTKLPVAVLAAPAARDGTSVNSRLIAQLTAAYTAPA